MSKQQKAIFFNAREFAVLEQQASAVGLNVPNYLRQLAGLPITAPGAPHGERNGRSRLRQRAEKDTAPAEP
jgi:hypothetical protein